MKRWLIILILAAVSCPDLAAASTKSSDVPLWKRLLAIITPSQTPAPTASHPSRRAARDHARPAATAEGATVAPPPDSEPARAPHGRPTGTDAGCNGGQRIVSAYYWEGRHTASGEPFNPHGMTAAHRTLPFGTRLTVTNPRTGQSVTVVINDRGPFVRGVGLDISLGAAKAIGLHGTGSVCIL